MSLDNIEPNQNSYPNAGVLEPAVLIPSSSNDYKCGVFIVEKAPGYEVLLSVLADSECTHWTQEGAPQT